MYHLSAIAKCPIIHVLTCLSEFLWTTSHVKCPHVRFFLDFKVSVRCIIHNYHVYLIQISCRYLKYIYCPFVKSNPGYDIYFCLSFYDKIILPFLTYRQKLVKLIV